MRQKVSVHVLSIDGDYGYTIIEIKAANAQPMSFAVHYDASLNRYDFSQTGENNNWTARPDERK